MRQIKLPPQMIEWGVLMKKLSLCFIAGFLALALYLKPISASAVEPQTAPASSAEETSLHLTSVRLEETEKWILDEVLSDYVSEDVVALMDSGMNYKIGAWVDRDTHTYLFFDRELPEGILYTACGYARTTDGCYVYFELSSPEKLTEEQVDMEVTKAFGNVGAGAPQTC